jgi:hypothetical protein
MEEKKCDPCMWADEIFFLECNIIVYLFLLNHTHQIGLLNITLARLSIYRTFGFFNHYIGADISDARP